MAEAALPVVFPIDFVGDVVCPWCFLGWTRLKSALASRPDLAPGIAWRPFQLQFDIPDAGLPYAAFMAGLFPDPSRRRAMDEELISLGAVEDLVFRFEAIAFRPNTNAAHRVIRWAGQGGAAMAEAVMRAYFSEGRDIGDASVLAEMAGAQGLDPAVVHRKLLSGADGQAVDEDCAMASRAGIHGVPFTILDNRIALSGAVEPAHILRAIDKALELRGPTP